MKPTSTEPQAMLLRPRVYIGESIDIGPGKIDLLRQVAAKNFRKRQ